MADAIVFRTPGLIDLRAFTVMGFNAKPNKVNPIGFFGTGLKYAVAVITRMGGTMTVFIGRDKYTFFAKKVDFRGKEFEQVWMRSERWHLTRARNVELPFTTEYGKNWEAWMAFRELEANTRDENGVTERWDSEDREPFGVKEETVILVDGLPAFVEAYDDRDTIFLDLNPNNIVAEDHGVQVRAGKGEHLYYQGLRAKDLPKPAMFDYNFKTTLGLTEDRTFQSDWHVRQNLAAFVTQCDDESLIAAIVTADEDTWEHGLDFPNHYTPSDAFRRVVERAPRGLTHGASSYYRRHAPVFMSRDPSPWQEKATPWRREGDTIVDALDRQLLSAPYDFDGNWAHLADDLVSYVNDKYGVDTTARLLEWNYTEPEEDINDQLLAVWRDHRLNPTHAIIPVGDDDDVPF